MKNLLFLLLLLPAVVQGQIINTFAGNGYTASPGTGIGSFGGDGGLATAAELNAPTGVAVDNHGNVYISDCLNDRIRKVNPSGIITTIAGTGAGGYNGDSIMATMAEIDTASSVAVDNYGNIYIADTHNGRIRKIDSSGMITTIAGNGSAGFSGDGGLAIAATLNLPMGVATDVAGNVYIADTYNNRIRKINTSGIITTIAGNGTAGYSGDGGSATAAVLFTPRAVATDNAGNIYITDEDFGCIRKIDTSNIITRIAGGGPPVTGYGDGGPATSAWLDNPTGVALDTYGNLYIGQCPEPSGGIGPECRVRKVNIAGIISTLAGGGCGYYGDGGQADSAELSCPSGVAPDLAGNVFIADVGNQRIRIVGATTGIHELSSPSQIITIFPNPTTTELTISTSDKITSLAIISVLGQTVYNYQYNSAQVKVDVTDLPTGVYFVKVNEVEVRKFVKQ